MFIQNVVWLIGAVFPHVIIDPFHESNNYSHDNSLLKRKVQVKHELLMKTVRQTLYTELIRCASQCCCTAKSPCPIWHNSPVYQNCFKIITDFHFPQSTITCVSKSLTAILIFVQHFRRKTLGIDELPSTGVDCHTSLLKILSAMKTFITITLGN